MGGLRDNSPYFLRIPIELPKNFRYDPKDVAGWSSLAARRAHNPKVVGSNPAPATNRFLSKPSILFEYKAFE